MAAVTALFEMRTLKNVSSLFLLRQWLTLHDDEVACGSEREEGQLERCDPRDGGSVADESPAMAGEVSKTLTSVDEDGDGLSINPLV